MFGVGRTMDHLWCPGPSTVRLRRALKAPLARTRREDGAVLPMVALMLVVIVGIAAFAIDVSSWYSDQQHLQLQPDAAVLAGANQLAGNLTSCSSQSTSINDAANNYSDASGAPNPVTSNGESGSVSGNLTVVCNSSGTYIDDTVTNTNPRPCDPNPAYAYTYNCTYTLTQ